MFFRCIQSQFEHVSTGMMANLKQNSLLQPHSGPLNSNSQNQAQNEDLLTQSHTVQPQQNSRQTWAVSTSTSPIGKNLGKLLITHPGQPRAYSNQTYPNSCKPIKRIHWGLVALSWVSNQLAVVSPSGLKLNLLILQLWKSSFSFISNGQNEAGLAQVGMGLVV